MKLFDIDVKIVILSSNFEKYDFKVPSYSYFDHAIIYIPSIDRYLDLTDNKVSYPYLPKSDINSKVLVLKQNSSLKTLNFKENELIKKEFTYEKLNKDLKVYHKESYYGSTGLNHLKTDFKKLKNLIYERYVNKYYNELTNFISYKVNQETRVIPYILNLEYILKNKLSGNIITLFQESDLFETKFAKTRNRVNSFYFNTKPKYEYIFKFKNINNIYSFQDKEFKNTYFNSSLILKDNIIYFKFNMNVKYISANEYINFKNKLKELDKLLLNDYYLEFKWVKRIF